MESGQRTKIFSFRSIALILILSMVFLWFGWYYYAKHEMDIRLEKLVASGVPTNIKEWYAQTEKNLPETPSPHAKRILDFLYDLKVSDFQISKGTTSPIFSDSLGADHNILYNDWPDDVIEDAQKVLESNAALLHDIEEIASYPPVHPAEAILFKRVDTLVLYPTPDLLAVRGIIDLLMIQSINALRQGNVDGAIASQEMAYRVVEHYEALPASLVNAMMSTAFRSIVYTGISEILDSNLQNAEHCKRIAELLKDRYPKERMYATLRFTRMESLEHYPGMLIDNDNLSQEFGRPYSVLDVLFKTVLKPYLYQDAAVFMDFWEKLLSVMACHENTPWMTQNAVQDKALLEPLAWYVMASIAAPNIARTGLNDMTAHSYHALIESSAALKQFQFDTGNFPESLDSLSPKYLDKVPLDLFDGQPLHYQKRDNGFSLWSVGEDLKDDGGKLDPKNPSVLQRNEDIVIQLQ